MSDLRQVLSGHWLTGIKCDEATKTDVATCYCTIWKSEPKTSVGDAVAAWIEHVVAAAEGRIMRPMSEAPQDGSVVLVETMRHCGVPETGGYAFRLMKYDGRGSWIPEAQKLQSKTGGSFTHESYLLGWYPKETDPATLTLTPRTNWNFRPSNGTGGGIFYDDWCARCIRERAIREDYNYAAANGLGCDIYMRTMAFDIGDPQYPKEWTYAPDDVPKCTAFDLDTGQPTQEPRCPHTLEMFPNPTET